MNHMSISTLWRIISSSKQAHETHETKSFSFWDKFLKEPAGSPKI